MISRVSCLRWYCAIINRTTFPLKRLGGSHQRRSEHCRRDSEGQGQRRERRGGLVQGLGSKEVSDPCSTHVRCVPDDS